MLVHQRVGLIKLAIWDQSPSVKHTQMGKLTHLNPFKIHLIMNINIDPVDSLEI